MFDPTEFTRNNPAPTKEEFELDNSVLMRWAVEGSKIREKMRRRSESFKESIGTTDTFDRSRRGLTLSVASRNPDGRSEKEIKHDDRCETVPGR